MKKTNWAISSVIASLLISAACSHKPTSTMAPEARNPAAESDLTQSDMDQVKNMILTKDEMHFQQKLLSLRIAQSLTSMFDARMDKIKVSKDMDSLLGSKLYCKIMEVRSAHDQSEEELIYGLTIAKSAGAANTTWFYEQMNQFAKTSLASQAAMAQLFRGLSNESIKICGSDDCVSKDSGQMTSLTVNPFSNKDMSRFLKVNRDTISTNGVDRIVPGLVSKNTDLEPGDCFSAESKRQPQGESYDWKNRNWVGSVLPDGQFVFTYDDGPHSSYTRVIRDAWADGGMAKPAFFWLRKNASNLSTIVSELNSQGYIIGSHSERHADLGNLAKSTGPADFNGVNRQMFGAETKGLSGSAYNNWKSNTLDREINQSVKDLSAILGKPVRYFRLPYGSGTKNDLIGARFEALNLDHFFWRIDSLDWQDKNPESIRDRVVGQMKVMKKGIILFHDIHPQSAAAAKLMVQYLKNNPSAKAVSIMDLPGLKP